MAAFSIESAGRKCQALMLAQTVQHCHVERGAQGEIRVRCLTWFSHRGGGEWSYLLDDEQTITGAARESHPTN